MVNAYQFSILILITSIIISCNNRGHIESGQGIFSLHVSSDTTGTVVDTGTHQVSESGEYELIAGQPSVGYTFSYWKVVSGEENITILNKDSVIAKVINAQGNAEVKAVFTKTMLSLNIITIPPFATDSIIVTPKPDDFSKFEYGSNVTVRIIPKIGWEITSWDGRVTGTSDSVTIILKNDVNDTVRLLPIKATSNIIYVNKDALQNGGGVLGSSWVDAYKDLNAALAVSEGKTVWVAKGTYTPIDINTPFTLSANSSVIGGFAGTESTAVARDSVHNTTILSGHISSTVNARAVVDIPQGADNVYVSTFTIEGAVGNTTAPYGGVYASMSNNLTLCRCIIQGNYPRAVETGYKNKILQCAIVNNNGGAGVGIQVQMDSAFIINTIISNNRATLSGAGISVAEGMHAILVNNTIFGNSTTNSGGGRTAGIYRATINTQTLISNCIIWGNTVDGTAHAKGTQINFSDTVYYSNIQDTANGTGIGLKKSGWSLAGILSTDPPFVNTIDLRGADGYFFTDDDGLMLRTGSLSIDAGGNVYNHNNWKPVIDIRGKSRLNNRIDIGAYEQ
jgi:hypothetical protein